MIPVYASRLTQSPCTWAHLSTAAGDPRTTAVPSSSASRVDIVAYVTRMVDADECTTILLTARSVTCPKTANGVQIVDKHDPDLE